MSRQLSILHAPVGSQMRRVLLLLAVVVVLVPAAAAGQEEPAAPAENAPTQEGEPTPDSEPAEPASDQGETPAPDPDPAPTDEQEREPEPDEEQEPEPAPVEEQEPTACALQRTESIVTDLSVYGPGSTAHIAGTDFSASCEASIEITAADGGLAPVVIEVETSSEGRLAADDLVDGDAGTYEVSVLGVDDEILASTTFAVTAADSSPDGCALQGTESVVTDKSSYAPRATVHITGDGYATSCDLQVEVTRPNGSVDTADVRVAPAVEEPDAARSAPAVEAEDDTSATGAFEYDYAPGDLTGLYKVRVLGTSGEAFAATAFAVEGPGPPSCGRRGSESIATDKADYAPGATVHMTGAGYGRSCLVKVEVTRPDGSIVKGDGSFEPGVDQVRTTARGRLAYDYVLNGIEGLYRVRVLGAGNTVLARTTFTDQIRAAPSDPRASFFLGNVVLCAGVGYPGDVRVGAVGSNDAADAFVVGNATASNPETLQVEITPAGTAAGVVVHAVVVKGSNGYNLYEAPYVPPGLAPPQNYISPRTGTGGPIADISHWFVCYSFEEIEPEVGSLLVLKEVVPPSGPPVEPLPTEFTVVVTCTLDGEIVEEETLTFGVGGGVRLGGPVTITGIPVGSTCTVEEQDTATFPDGTVVTYRPAGAPTDGVVIGEGAGVVVGVVNDFSDVEVQTGSLQVNKVLIPPPPGVDLPDSFVVHVTCDDGTDVLVTVPADGSATVEGITADAYCLVEEQIGSLPPDLEVTYSPSPAVVQIVADETVEVTITNDASNVSGGGVGPSDAGGRGGVADSSRSQPTGELPLTGAPAWLVGGLGLALIAGGLALAWRRKAS